MKHHEGRFEGVRGTEIYYQYWLPDDEPDASLLIVHGLAEHCGRYANVIDRLVPRGYAVYGIDHIGHGKSGGRRVYVEQFDDFVAVLRTYVDRTREWQPGYRSSSSDTASAR